MAMNVSQNQRGVSIIAVVATMLILSVMGVTLISLVTTGSDVSINQLQSEQAFNIANGGIEFGLHTTTRGGGSWGEFTFSNRPLGAGSFTLTTNTSIIGNERRLALNSRAAVGGILTAKRNITAVVVRGTGAATILNEPFPVGSIPSDAAPGNGCAVSPALSWCYSYTNTQGVSQYHADNAPSSTGGSLEAETQAVANSHFTGYRQRILSTTITQGTQVTLNHWYKKQRGHAQTQLMNTAVYLVATDNTPYQLWVHNSISNVGWTQINTPFTVPAGKTIDRIRLSFDIQNRVSGSGSTNPSYIWFDSVSLTTTGSIPVTFVSVKEVY